MRVVSDQRPRADDDGVGLGAQPVYVGARPCAGDPAARPVGGRHASVQARRVLPGDVRPAEPHRRQPGLVEASRLTGEEADLDVDPGAAQNVGAPARGLVGIAYCGDHTAYPRRDERLGAWTGQTGVCAGLESDQGGAATGKRAGFGERAYLSMRSAAVLMEASADDLSSG